MRLTAVLYPEDTPGLEQTPYTVAPEGVFIGRSAEADLFLPADSVSRRHARIEEKDGRWIVTDLGSSNGTFVNGHRIAEATPLADGDTVMFGKATLVFRLEKAAPAEAAPDQTNEFTSSVRIVADDSQSIVFTTRATDQTPFTASTENQAAEDVALLNLRLSALYRLSDALRSAKTRAVVVDALLDSIFEVLQADRGAVLMYDADTGKVTPERVKIRSMAAGQQDMVISQTVLRRVLDERAAVLSCDVQADPELQHSESMMASGVRSIMAVPLAGKQRMLGAVVLDTCTRLQAFSEEDLAFVSTLAMDAGLTLENLLLAGEMVQQERLAAVGQTIAGLAHNIKNILQLARGGTELMDMAIEHKNLEEISTLWPITRRSIERMQTLTREMLDYSRPATCHLQLVCLAEIVKTVAEVVQGEAKVRQVALVLENVHQPVRITADPDILTKAMLNLLSNAFDAMAHQPDAVIRMGVSRLHSRTAIVVRDNGPGIPPEDQARVFQPFFSTKGSKGNGLGLSMTRRYVEDMGARLELSSEAGKGCEFRIVFPSDDDV